MTELCELAKKWHADKYQHYSPFYDALFQNTCNFKKVMEIGIGTTALMTHVNDYIIGASIYMWEEYFPSADIYTIDIEESVLINKGRIQSMKCDQRNESDLLRVIQWAGDQFDLVLDDGDHNPESQLIAFKSLINVVRLNGFYIVEDAVDQDRVSKGMLDLGYPNVIATIKPAGGKLVMTKPEWKE